MQLFTLGYGGRMPAEFVALLKQHGIATVVDVRLRPDKSSMGAYVRAKDPTRGIEGLLAGAGIGYVSMVPLGNLFVNDPDVRMGLYQQFLERMGDIVTAPLAAVTGPICLLCAEKVPEQCHRWHLATYLEQRGWAVTHIR